MNTIQSQLTILFVDPYWIGIYERSEGKKMEACKIIFGTEPKDYEVYQYLNTHWYQLKFGPSVEVEESSKLTINPKRLQRKISKELRTTGISTKAQLALAAQREENKIIRKAKSKLEKEREKEKQYALHKQKKKEKHRGH